MKVFDGRAYALKMEKRLALDLKKSGKKPYLVSIIVGSNPASVMYVNIKKKTAERIGALVDTISFNEVDDVSKITETIDNFNKDPKVTGIMIQLPLPAAIENQKKLLINKIAPEKDVDGLRDDSLFIHPTTAAVLQIMKEALRLKREFKNTTKVCVFGKRGMVGSSLVKEISKLKKMVLIDDSKKADILISATGSPGLVKAPMIKKGALVIDVGSPKGDVDFEDVSQKASFITPVPGGVGPMTVTFLLDNLIKACK